MFDNATVVEVTAAAEGSKGAGTVLELEAGSATTAENLIADRGVARAPVLKSALTAAEAEQEVQTPAGS